MEAGLLRGGRRRHVPSPIDKELKIFATSSFNIHLVIILSTFAFSLNYEHPLSCHRAACSQINDTNGKVRSRMQPPVFIRARYELFVARNE